MTPNDYQKLAARTANGTHGPYTLANWALGLAGEAGEAADLIKKHVFHAHGLDKDKLVKELGDVLWYIANVAETLGVQLEDVMQKNVTKLLKRYPDGFSTEASLERKDVE